MSTQPAVRRWTYEEFARLPNDGSRYEVIGGELFVTPAPTPRHQKVLTRLIAALDSFSGSHGLGEVFAPIDVLFGEGDYLEPDLVFVSRGRLAIITDRAAEAAPDLVVEVLSPTTAMRDRGIKRERYARFGVKEYWIVDIQRSRVERYLLQDDPDRPVEHATDTLDWQPVAGGPVLTLNVPDLLRDFR
ncbi:MAG TPA: Uma2 family endonuclease [Longimicrobium sp.]|nr:Uma2 family endonuclease [Longimicrobium sp.]